MTGEGTFWSFNTLKWAQEPESTYILNERDALILVVVLLLSQVFVLRGLETHGYHLCAGQHLAPLDEISTFLSMNYRKTDRVPVCLFSGSGCPCRGWTEGGCCWCWWWWWCRSCDPVGMEMDSACCPPPARWRQQRKKNGENSASTRRAAAAAVIHKSPRNAPPSAGEKTHSVRKPVNYRLPDGERV